MKMVTPMVPRPANEQALADALARCAHGEKLALREIYDAQAGVMLGVAQRIVRRRELAEDVLHDAFVRIWQNAATFDASRGSPRAWLFTIVRNLALNLVRSEKRTELFENLEHIAFQDDVETPEAIVSRMSDAQSLKRCLENLAPERQRLLVLAYTHGLTHGEIAGRMKMPLGTVKAWIRRSLLALRECLA